MEDCDTRYHLQGMVELDDTYIGGKRKTGKRGRGARSKVPVLVAVESRSKDCGHVALRGLSSLSSHATMDFLGHKHRHDTAISADGLYLYRPVVERFALSQTVLGNGTRAIGIFPDVHRVIARLKTRIRGTHSHMSCKDLNRYLDEFSYRFNQRFKQRRVTIFDRLVMAYCSTQAVTYRQLVVELSGLL